MIDVHLFWFVMFTTALASFIIGLCVAGAFLEVPNKDEMK